jgi:hypothetical protein
VSADDCVNQRARRKPVEVVERVVDLHPLDLGESGPAAERPQPGFGQPQRAEPGAAVGDELLMQYSTLNP